MVRTGRHERGGRRSVGAVVVLALVAGGLVAAATATTLAGTAGAVATSGSLGYRALAVPCRAVDTSVRGGAVAPRSVRRFQIGGAGSLVGQGGPSAGCGVPDGVGAVVVSVTAQRATASGFLRAFAADLAAPPGATFLNFAAGRPVTNTGIVPLAPTGTPDLAVAVFGAATHLVVDVVGYFTSSSPAAGYVPLAAPCRAVSTSVRGGRLAAGSARSFQLAGGGGGFAVQGGTAGGCGVPDGVVAVEASVTAVSPAGTGSVLVGANDGRVPTVPLVALASGAAATNTAPLTLGNRSPADVIVRAVGASTQLVVDVVGYYVVGGGSRYRTVTPCRVFSSTTAAGGPLAPGTSRSLQVAGTRGVLGVQGVAPTGCGVPQRAAAVHVAASAVAPGGLGFARVFPAGSVDTGTFLNFSQGRSVTNTGSVPLALGGGTDLHLKGFGAVSGYVVDVLGFFEPSRTLPRSAESIAAGDGHSCMVVGAGAEVRCWGLNLQGQLGTGTVDVPFDSRAVPVPVVGLTGVLQVAVGDRHSCALLTVGTVRCWGENVVGQLGDGTTVGSPRPVAVTGLSGAVQLSARGQRTCAVLQTGAVRCWGRGIGGGAPSVATTPFTVGGMSDAVQVAVGTGHVCVLRVAGTAACWGGNLLGALGTGDLLDRAAPTPVVGLSGAVQLVAGQSFSCALLANGPVHCWGAGSSGQLGNGRLDLRTRPAPVVDVQDAVRITAGELHACAVRSSGTVGCWGSNVEGRLGDGTTSRRTSAVRVAGLRGAAEASAGGRHTCAVLATGVPQCWGLGGRTGAGPGTSDQPVPAAVSGFAGVVAVAAGESHSCALLAAGTVRCWGANTSGQLGDRTTAARRVPVPVAGLDGAVQVVAGGAHTCALLLDATVRCWGANADGQLGDGSTTASGSPRVVAGLTDVVGITVGGAHSCALVVDRTVRCWGRNGSGQLGTGSTTPRSVPTAVAGLTAVTALAAGESHTCAALADRTARCWGRNAVGQLGDGSTFDRSVPVRVVGVTGAVALAGDSNHSCALLLGPASGALYRCWGTDGSGQLGDPALAPGSLTSIDTGRFHTCALVPTGEVACWGFNGTGELGLGTTDPVAGGTVPASVTGIRDAVGLAVGTAHSCLVRADGSARCWGFNGQGQLGDGTVVDRSATAPVFGLP